jgi:8-oxo-dGTP diphosphatase
MPQKFIRPAAAASIAVHAKKENAILVIIRQNEPFKNRFAFPGGFIETGNEDLYDTGIRELFEETGLMVKKEELILIDIRSQPNRDPRFHTIDVGFLCIIDHVLKVQETTDEAIPQWIPFEKMDTLNFAFDHRDFWIKTKYYILNREKTMKDA